MQRKRLSNSLGILPIVIIILGLVLIAVGAVLLLRSRTNPPLSATTPSSPAAATQVAGGEPSYPEIQRVSLDDAKKAFDDGNAVFLDVRSATSFGESHIPGALNIPLADINTRSGELDPNQWIITYCT